MNIFKNKDKFIEFLKDKKFAKLRIGKFDNVEMGNVIRVHKDKISVKPKDRIKTHYLELELIDSEGKESRVGIEFLQIQFRDID
jgi:hypothetical protein